MKRYENKFEHLVEHKLMLERSMLNMKPGQFLRKGKIGDYTNCFSEVQRKMFNEKLKKELLKKVPHLET